MYKSTGIKPFEQKVWLASPTMHGEELMYMTQAYETNWMSTVGANINEVETTSFNTSRMLSLFLYAVSISVSSCPRNTSISNGIGHPIWIRSF